MEIKEAIDFINEKIQIDVSLLTNEEVSRTVEVLNMAISALEKQDAKKPINVCYCKGKIENAECPSCGYDFPDIGGVCESYHECEQYNCCPDCGQKIDWSE